MDSLCSSCTLDPNKHHFCLYSTRETGRTQFYREPESPPQFGHLHLTALFSSHPAPSAPTPHLYILHLDLPSLQSDREQIWQLNEPTLTTCKHPRGLASHSGPLTIDRSKPLPRPCGASLQFRSIPLTLGRKQKLHCKTSQTESIP